MRLEQAGERKAIAEQVHKQAALHFASLQTKFRMVELPRILQVQSKTLRA